MSGSAIRGTVGMILTQKETNSMKHNYFYERGKKYNCRKNGRPYFRKTATIAGKRRQFYGDGEKDAIRKIKEAEQLARTGFNLDTKNAKIGPTIRYWLFNVKRVDRNLKASTFARYDIVLRNQVENRGIMALPLSKLTSATLQAYFTSLYEDDHLSGGTITNVAKVWRMFCLWAVSEGYLVRNPCTKLSLPGERVKGRPAFEIFTEAERQAISSYMEASNYRYSALIRLAFATGMREGELLALRWSDIHDGAIHVCRSAAKVSYIDKDGNRTWRKEVWDTKTPAAVRTIPILPATEKMLAKHRAAQRKALLAKGLPQSEYVFTTAGGELLTAAQLFASYRSMLARAGVKYRKFHAIRHTFATEAIRRGMDVKDLQQIMGHSSIKTTYIYVQSDDNSKRQAIQKMGALM